MEQHSTEIDRFALLPVLAGSYSIDKFLLGSEMLQPGCWVEGATVFGKVSINGKLFSTYSRPVFAVMTHVASKRTQGQHAETFEVSIDEGFSPYFFSSLKGEYTVSSALDLVNICSELSLGLSAKRTWSVPVKTLREVELPAAAQVHIYQQSFVYAHCVVGGCSQQQAFTHGYAVNQPRPDSLFYLSSVATSKVVVVEAANATSPFSWSSLYQDVAKRVLMFEVTDPVHIDFSADQSAHRRY